MPTDPRGDDRPATLDDVARLAGVSVATASKAVNGRDQVAPATRRRVLEAASELAFTPNQTARSLLAGRSGTVGLLASDLDGRFMIPILTGAEDAFGAGQINVFLCDARGDSIREQHHLRALLNRRVDGIIVVGDDTNPRPSLGKLGRTPVVYVYAPSDDINDISIVPDDEDGARKATAHILATGRRRLVHIAGDETFVATRDRARAIEAALTGEGMALCAPVIYGHWSEQWGRDATAALIEQHPEIDGIICGSDQIARGALDTLRDLGRRVPEDVAVMGFDNWTVLTEHARPHLTSVDPGLEGLGRLAARSIFDSLAGQSEAPGLRRVPGSLVVRSSTLSRR